MDAAELEREGWSIHTTGPFVELTGPFWSKGEGTGRQFGFLPRTHHANSIGIVHGGMIMTFADSALGQVVLDTIGGARCATIQFQTHFAAAVRIGDFVICRGEVVRRSLTLIFVRGILSVREKPVASVDGIWKVLAHKPRRI